MWTWMPDMANIKLLFAKIWIVLGPVLPFYLLTLFNFVWHWSYVYLAFHQQMENSQIQQFKVFLPDSSAFLNGKPSGCREISLCKFGSFQWTSCHNAMSIGPTRGSWTKQNQKSRVKTKPKPFLKLFQNMKDPEKDYIHKMLLAPS